MAVIRQTDRQIITIHKINWQIFKLKLEVYGKLVGECHTCTHVQADGQRKKTSTRRKC